MANRVQYETQFLLGAKVQASLGKAFGGVQKNMQAMQKQASITERAYNGIGSALKGLTGAAAAYVGLNAAKDLAAKTIDTIDNYASINARINIMNTGLETTSQLQDMIFKSAQNSRGSYIDMTSSIAKMGILSKESFRNNTELIEFTELLQKSFKIGGASAQEQTAAMYQLTQAMSAGKLQGDEFRSIMENAPLLAEAIAKYTGKSKGYLKEMSKEGTITSDVIKASVFAMANDINNKFNTMPRNFGDIMMSIKNNTIKSFGKSMDTIIKYLNNPKIINALNKQEVIINSLQKNLSNNFIKFKNLGLIAFNNINKAVIKNKPTLDAFKLVVINIGQRLYDAFTIAKPVISWIFTNGFPLLIDLGSRVLDGVTFIYNMFNNWTTIEPIIKNIGIAYAGWKIIEITESVIKLTAAMKVLVGWKMKDIFVTGALTAMYVWESLSLKAILFWNSAVILATSAWTIVCGIAAGATWAFGIAMAFLTSPIGLIILAIGAVIVAGVLLYKNWDKIKSVAADVWVSIKNSFADFMNFFIPGINSLIEIINKIPGVNIPIIKDKFTKEIKPSQQKLLDYYNSHKGIGGSGFEIPQHKTGLNYVPNDGYVAELHKGEAVVPAKYNPYNSRAESLLNRYKGNRNNQTVSVSYSPQIIIQGNADANVIGEANKQSFKDFEKWYYAVVDKKRRLNFA